MARAPRHRRWRGTAFALAACCALVLLMTYRPAVQVSTSEPAPVRKKVQNWTDVPADLDIPSGVPGWASQPFAPSKLEEGEVPPNENWISQFKEDKWMFDHLFYNRRNGFYLEFGAMDGHQFSNTKWLHDNAGWKGLLIEADPGQYAALVRNRPNDITVGAAICDTFRKLHYVFAGGVGGFWEFMAPGYKDIFHKNVDPSKLPEVPCVPLMYLLDRFGINHIHFWSLDVEGAELPVLESFDFDRVAVDVVMVETDGHNKTKDAAISSLMVANGFVDVEHSPNRTHGTMNGMDSVYVHKRFMPHRSSAPGVTQLKIETTYTER